MSTPAAGGAEVLLVDRDRKTRKALRDILARQGFSVTAPGDPETAKTLAREKHFAVCVVDLDTPTEGGGAALIRELREASPTSAVVGLAPRKAFQLGVEAFRAGAVDVIVKSREGVRDLRERVAREARSARRSVERDRLLADLGALQEKFVERLMQAARRVADLEERSTVSGTISQSGSLCRVLCVDADEQAVADLDARLGSREGFALVGAPSGGAALDYVGRERYQVVLVKDGLPDLPADMVARSIRDLSPDSVVVRVAPPGEGPGTLRTLEQGAEDKTLRATFKDAEELAARVVELRDAQIALSRERRYLRAFREQNLDLLRKHAEARRKIEIALRQAKDGQP